MWRVFQGRGRVITLTWATEGSEEAVMFGQFPSRDAKRYPVEEMLQTRSLNTSQLGAVHIVYKDEDMPNIHTNGSSSRFVN
jgi:hypothetical protein